LESGSTQEIFDTVLVGWVIRNRVEKGGWYGDGYAGVCLNPWQFSCWNEATKGKPTAEMLEARVHAAIIPTGPKFALCEAVADYILTAPARHNPLPGVLHYANLKLCSPDWQARMIQVVPDWKIDHTFFREKA